MSYVLWFGEEQADVRALVGGKGANLGKLVKVGFEVPGGFTVSTEAYNLFMQETGIGARIEQALTEFDYGHADLLERQTSAIREQIAAADMPEAITAAITAAYDTLTGDAAQAAHTAVRSSGTAEDLAEASFAGLHDTYLDICGADQVLDAVKRCWASLWTARATSYRNTKGFDQHAARLAVVVQEMVDSDVAGVMFTANPLTARVDEFVINASWGLGEAVVSGEVTPDEFVVSRRDHRVKRFTLGSKALRVVRDESTGSGTVTVPVPEHLQNTPTMTDAQTARLADLGARVMAFYHGLPQDIEWALADDRFYLLQSRDVTGVELTWDEDIDESFQRDPDQNDDVLWTNQWAREFWTGAITPLHYSVRGLAFEYSNEVYRSVLGFDDIVKMRLFKYRRATAYFNTLVDATHYTYMLPNALRAGMLGNVHPDDREAVTAAPFDPQRMIKALLKAEVSEQRHGLYTWLDASYEYINNTRTEQLFVKHGRRDGPAAEELRSLADDELKEHCEARMKFAADFNAGLWDGFFGSAPTTFALLGWMITNWYGAADPSTFQDLISGLPENWMIRESRALWDLGGIIRDSATLRTCFEQHSGAEFFTAVQGVDGGKRFVEEFGSFMERFGHRGHADRDMFYDRRVENHGLVYDALRAIVQSDASSSPYELEQKHIANREATTAQIIERLRTQPLGVLRVEAFKWTLGYVHKFLTLREDERWCYDRLTLAKKVAFQEAGRRCVERGLLSDAKDFYFLSKHELFEVLDGTHSPVLIAAKIAGRRKVFDRFLAREEIAPMYLKGDQVLVVDSGDGEGGLRGTGTSRGLVTARARIVRNLELIGKVEKGDILVCNATDPGWASIFVLIKGLVIETGGLLCHGACLSREYGLPAVTLENAMNLIPDGALITVNGDTGEITLVDEEGAEANEPEPVLTSG